MATHNSEQHVALSLVNKAPLACMLCVLLVVVVALVTQPMWYVLGFATLSGISCAALLLAYWSRKGGVFFVLGLLVPLLSVMMMALPSFTSLYQLILAFFCGFWLSLWVFKLATAKTSSGAPR